MKNQILNKLTAISIVIFALSIFAFGQANEGFTNSTKSNTKNALTRTETVDPKIKEGMIQALKVGKMDFPKPPPPPKGAYVSQTGEKYAFAQAEVNPTRKELVEGVKVGIIYVEANSKQLPNGYYTVQIKQSGKDDKGNPVYDINLLNQSGVQALSIGAKTNGSAGNSTGLGAKRVAMQQGNSGGTTKGTQVSGTTQAKSESYEARLRAEDNEARIRAEDNFAPKFVNNGGKETLSTEGLDTQIVEAVARFVSTTKSNVKNA